MYKHLLSIFLFLGLSACVVLPKHRYHVLVEDSRTQSEAIARLESENSNLKAENAALRARMKQALTDLKSFSKLFLGSTSLSRNYPKKAEK